MLDSQNASLSDLKAEVARLKSVARDAEDEAGRTTAGWKERLRDEIEQVSRLDAMLTSCMIFMILLVNRRSAGEAGSFWSLG